MVDWRVVDENFSLLAGSLRVRFRFLFSFGWRNEERQDCGVKFQVK